MMHMLYLMATHSSQMINYSAAKFTEFYAEKSLFHVEKSSRTFMVGSWYWSDSFLILWFWSVVLHPKVLIPSIWFMVLCYYGFGLWYCERPMTIKEEGDHLAKHHLNCY